ncbi:jg10492 [Pararge aegeria aegeria]|uniref:Jg10492 protein n=1 Tax=Pararge aegeria aegeria TaxID=348720 RepID=A0A8S4RG63_9NEOP|nr:jg10492 [Pararge aegeria aegeria]
MLGEASYVMKVKLHLLIVREKQENLNLQSLFATANRSSAMYLLLTFRSETGGDPQMSLRYDSLNSQHLLKILRFRSETCVAQHSKQIFGNEPYVAEDLFGVEYKD